MKLTNRQRNTIIAALQFFRDNCDQFTRDQCNDNDDPLLSDEEINTLCEQINEE